MKYNVIGTSIMAPDIYNEVDGKPKPFWVGNFYDQESTDFEIIQLIPEAFPAGTRVIIEVPVCPTCGMDSGECVDVCDFDWKMWVDDEFQ